MAVHSPLLPLKHMLDAIAAIRRLTAGATLADFRNDEIRRAALERFFEIVSEASRRVPAELKGRRPEIPWRAVGALGNRIRHEYHEVRLDMLWQIAMGDLDQLAAALEALEAELGPPMPEEE